MGSRSDVIQGKPPDLLERPQQIVLLDLQLLGINQILEGAAAALPEVGTPGLDPERGAGFEARRSGRSAAAFFALETTTRTRSPGTAPGTKVTTSPIFPTPQSWGRATSMMETTWPPLWKSARSFFTRATGNPTTFS